MKRKDPAHVSCDRMPPPLFFSSGQSRKEVSSTEQGNNKGNSEDLRRLQGEALLLYSLDFLPNQIRKSSTVFLTSPRALSSEMLVQLQLKGI